MINLTLDGLWMSNLTHSISILTMAGDTELIMIYNVVQRFFTNC